MVWVLVKELLVDFIGIFKLIATSIRTYKSTTLYFDDPHYSYIIYKQIEKEL